MSEVAQFSVSLDMAVLLEELKPLTDRD